MVSLIRFFCFSFDRSSRAFRGNKEKIYGTDPCCISASIHGKIDHGFLTFSDAYQYALSQGESLTRLAPFESLFRWYRMYGYSSGVAIQPSGCTDEYRSPQSYQAKQFDPQQEKMARDFLAGVGMTLSGVFCIAVSPPLLGRFGVPLIVSGFKTMYSSVSDMIKDRREKDMRLKELQNLQKSIENIAPKDKN